ncbi:alpha/beta fold hydrolase [Paenibacillus alkalitolerans]|uniref:alpha/beta fold hydrolase n=1 Tax=Paenibacillus alkalitolerans TaxID=2799335 RepID=UPI0018F6EEA1|nr:alpha/beta hydrolase [Paenibacillus alkalitolerans]
MRTVGVVFIQGAGLKSEIWEQVAAGINAPFLLIDYPQNRRKLTLQDYASHIKRRLEAWEVEKFIIVAHSLGGVVALKVAGDMPERLAGFAAVGAAIPKQGGSFLSVLPFAQRMLTGVLMRIFGTKPPESAILKGLCSDVTPEQAAEVAGSFVAESIRVYTDRSEATAPNVPKLYVKLANDREMSSSLQDQMISNLAPQHVEALETGHLPMLSRPDELALALNKFLSQC